MQHLVSLAPLNRSDHIAALQRVYQEASGYWRLYGLPAASPDQADRDLTAAAETPDRQIIGIVRRVDPVDPESGVELVGALDLRLHWPEVETAYIGLLIVAEAYQKQGIGRQAWLLLEPWLAQSAGIAKARLGVEQFNPGALQFFQEIGFGLTGESNRIEVGRKWVRVLYMERVLQREEQRAGTD
jgi:ribosomal protein S18 acetylase RimI-like enzyme